jgi:hypothetical protein
MTILTHDLASASNDQRVALEASAPAVGKISTLDKKFKKKEKLNTFLKKHEQTTPHRFRTVTNQAQHTPGKKHVPFHSKGKGRALDFLFLEVFSFNTGMKHNSKHLYFAPNQFDVTGNLMLDAKAIMQVPKTFDEGGKPTSWHQQPLKLKRIHWLMDAFASIGTKCIDVSNELQRVQNLNGVIHKTFTGNFGDHSDSYEEEVSLKLNKRLWDVTHHSSEDKKLVMIHAGRAMDVDRVAGMIGDRGVPARASAHYPGEALGSRMAANALGLYYPKDGVWSNDKGTGPQYTAGMDDAGNNFFRRDSDNQILTPEQFYADIDAVNVPELTKQILDLGFKVVETQIKENSGVIDPILIASFHAKCEQILREHSYNFGNVKQKIQDNLRASVVAYFGTKAGDIERLRAAGDGAGEMETDSYKPKTWAMQ